MFMYEETKDLGIKLGKQKKLPKNGRFKTKSRILNPVLFPYVLTTL